MVVVVRRRQRRPHEYMRKGVRKEGKEEWRRVEQRRAKRTGSIDANRIFLLSAAATSITVNAAIADTMTARDLLLLHTFADTFLDRSPDALV